MCLAIPGKVVKLFEENELLMGHVDFNGTINVTCMAYVPEIKIGEYVIVHAGFAISVLNEKEAQEVLKTWDEFGERVKDISNINGASSESASKELN
jgi:hydrogenase expression/formation protein HypC